MLTYTKHYNKKLASSLRGSRPIHLETIVINITFIPRGTKKSTKKFKTTSQNSCPTRHFKQIFIETHNVTIRASNPPTLHRK